MVVVETSVETSVSSTVGGASGGGSMGVCRRMSKARWTLKKNDGPDIIVLNLIRVVIEATTTRMTVMATRAVDRLLCTLAPTRVVLYYLLLLLFGLLTIEHRRPLPLIKTFKPF